MLGLDIPSRPGAELELNLRVLLSSPFKENIVSESDGSVVVLSLTRARQGQTTHAFPVTSRLNELTDDRK